MLETLKPKRAKVLGIDCSTYSLAYSIYEDGNPKRCGEVTFSGSNLYERMNDAQKKVRGLVDAGILTADYVAFEEAYQGPNSKVGLQLSLMYGAVIGALMQKGMEVKFVSPLTWQSYIGNPNLKKEEKEQIRRDNPGKSESWYKNHMREFRKQRTHLWAKEFFDIDSGSDNVSDAVAIGYYCANVLTRH